MENKYYTPKIEEFHVGFKYEVFQKGEVYDPNFMYLIPPDTEDKWIKYIYPDPFLGYNLDKMFKTYIIRVKYLDREDIESFNFHRDKIRSKINGNFGGTDGFWYLDYSPYTLKGEFESKTKVTIWAGTVKMFEGYIKNKLELMKVFIQIGRNGEI